METKTRVIIADDHRLVRLGFRRLLEDAPDLMLVGEADDGEQAVRQSEALSPDVVVMDCAMPGLSGIDATRRILERAPRVAVLMLSMHAEHTLVRQALRAGARGYILKSALDLDLAAAVRRAASGETFKNVFKSIYSMDLETFEIGFRAYAVMGKTTAQDNVIQSYAK